MKIGFVGFGNMASAMADGWIAAGVVASDMCACAGRYDALVERCEARGMAACHDAAEVVAASDIVVAAVKPYMIEKVFAPLKDALAKKVVLSVAWTWDSVKWEQVLPGVAHISTVPNTPVSVGEGVIACEKASTLSDEQSAVVLDLLGKLGAVVELDTSLLFVGGTVGGCAPAFVAMAIEALGDAAVKHGIPRADAYRIVSQMVLGTAKLQLATGQHPAAMKDAVCSPGGATIKGVVALEDAGMRSALVKAIDATLQQNRPKKTGIFWQVFPAVLSHVRKTPRNWLNSSCGALAFAQIKPTKINLPLFGRLVPEAVFLILGLGSAVDVHLMGTLLHYKGKNRK